MDNNDQKMKKQVVAEEYLLKLVRSNFEEIEMKIDDRKPFQGKVVQMVDIPDFLAEESADNRIVLEWTSLATSIQMSRTSSRFGRGKMSVKSSYLRSSDRNSELPK